MKSAGRFVLVALVAFLAVLAIAGCDRASQSSYPTKTIEIAVGGSPGGGSDIFARTMTSIIQQNKLLPVSVDVVNKPGGSGNVAKDYVAEKAGDPHYLMTTSTNFLTSVILGTTKLGTSDFTPLANFSEDNFVILVKTDSPIQSIKDLIDAAKKNPGKVNWAGSQVGNPDHQLMYFVQKATGTQFNFVSFEGGGEVMTAVLGGHVDVGSAQPSEAAGQIKAKTVRVLATAGNKRLLNLPDVPTLKEQGIDVVHTQWRGLVGSKGMPPSTVKVLEDALKKMAAAPEWAKYLKDNDQTENFMSAEDTGKYLVTEYKKYDELLGSLGMKK